MVAKLGELRDQAPGLVLGRTAIEVISPEIAMFDAVVEDVINRREQ